MPLLFLINLLWTIGDEYSAFLCSAGRIIMPGYFWIITENRTRDSVIDRAPGDLCMETGRYELIIRQ